MMLTAEEAAARLGVKRATLYAYVSRGLLNRQVAIDGRTSLFDADEISSFRSSRKSVALGELSTVVATGLTRVSDDALLYRGRDVTRMMASDMDYERAVDWLWNTAAPWPENDAAVAAAVAAQSALPASAPSIDRLRLITAVASALDPLRHDLSPAACHAAGRLLLATMVNALPPLGTTGTQGRLADRLWTRLSPRRATKEQRRALNAAMVALLDHGLAGSTFAVRIAASVRADPYSCVGAGLGVGGGTFHGAASAVVHELFAAAHESGDAAEAVGHIQRRQSHMPGFGHSVYKKQDPRFGALMSQIALAWSDDDRMAVVQDVRDVVSERSDQLANIDFALGAMSFLADMQPDAGETVFMVARTAGWIAHAIEEYTEAPVRFRPRARYTGPSVDERDGVAPVDHRSTLSP